MLQHLRTISFKALPIVELTFLGQINVICGRNDSGKTTLLEAISDDRKQFKGVHAPGTYDELPALIGPARNDSEEPDTRVAAHFRIAFHEALSSRPVWYENDARDFQALFLDHIQRNPILQHSIRYQDPGLVPFRALFPKSVRSVLIPAQRRLQTTHTFHEDGPPLPDGTGVLKQLHFLKNQQVKSYPHHLHLSIGESFREITDGYAYDTTIDTGGRVALCFSRDGAHWYPADACGVGLQEILLILYFLHLGDIGILCIEEPERHLHADAQRRLLSHFRSHSFTQIFLTTHSNVFLSADHVDRVFLTRLTRDVIDVDDATSRAAMLEHLGYSISDNLIADVVVLVEGPTDVPVLNEFAKKMGWPGRINVRIWPMGGDIMAQLDLSTLTAAYRTIALVDRDDGSARVRRLFRDACTRHGVVFHKLERSAIENYFTIDAIKAVFRAQVPDTLTAIDPDTNLEQQLGFSVKKQNRKVVATMSLADIAGTDLADFLARVEALARGA